nr:hypothetical protein [Tanacetum cinerariifolium]
ALLREAMQGQLLPQDPTDEPAAVMLQQLQAAAKPGKKGRGQAGALFAEAAEAVEGLFEVPTSWLCYSTTPPSRAAPHRSQTRATPAALRRPGAAHPREPPPGRAAASHRP